MNRKLTLQGTPTISPGANKHESFVKGCLRRFAQHDWGNHGLEIANEHALKSNERANLIFGVYDESQDIIVVTAKVLGSNLVTDIRVTTKKELDDRTRNKASGLEEKRHVSAA